MNTNPKLPVLLGAAMLSASLTACGTGGETDSQNNGKPTPTAVPTHNDTSDDATGGDNDSNKGPDGSGT